GARHARDLGVTEVSWGPDTVSLEYPGRAHNAPALSAIPSPRPGRRMKRSASFALHLGATGRGHGPLLRNTGAWTHSRPGSGGSIGLWRVTKRWNSAAAACRPISQ